MQDPRGLNQLAVQFGIFLANTVAYAPINETDPLPIPVDNSDTVYSEDVDQLDFFRSIRAISPLNREDIVRPTNEMTSAVDLGSVYGGSKLRRNVVSSGINGLLKSSEGGDFLPLNTFTVDNIPSSRNAGFFVAGSVAANESPMLISIHTLFLREHNSLAAEISRKFPEWSDRLVFEEARRVNIAQMQKVVFKEWYPAVVGKELPEYTGFKQSVDSTVSLLFSTVGTRVFRSMLAGDFCYTNGAGDLVSTPLRLFSLVDVVNNVQKLGIEPFLKASLVKAALRRDLMYDDAIRNYPRTSVMEASGDLAAADLQRGRDHALPGFGAVRKALGLGEMSMRELGVKKMERAMLRMIYSMTENLEPLVGVLAEESMTGSSFGETLGKLWETELLRIRDGDFFYYENDGHFTEEMKKNIPRVNELFTNGSVMEDILTRNGVPASKTPFFV